MLQKYKKIGLAAAACTLLGMAASEAAVTLTFAQVGSDVVATWSGSYDLPTAASVTFPVVGVFLSDAGILASEVGGEARYSNLPGIKSYTISIPSVFVGTYVGDTFGFNHVAQVVFPVGASGVFSPVGTMTFTSTTLAGLGVDSFNNQLAYTGGDNVGGSQQVFFTTVGAPSAVPEPAGTSTALICCVSGLLIRTRQRRRL